MKNWLPIILSGLLGGSCFCNAFVAPNGRSLVTITGNGMDTMKIVRYLDDSALRFSPEGAETDSQMQRLEATSTSNDIDLLKKKLLSPKDFVPLGILATVIFSLVFYQLQLIQNAHVINIYGLEESNRYFEFAKLFSQNGLLSFALIFTHILPLTFITPLIFLSVEDKGEIIQKDFPQFNPALIKLSFVLVAVGLGMETCWHIIDSWYYDKDFHIINFAFYFFLTSAFSTWAAALESDKFWNVINFLVLGVICLWYPVGMCNKFELPYPSFIPEDWTETLKAAGGSKFPCIAGLSVPFIPIWLKGKKIFEEKMNIVVFFSVGVNLAFILALSTFGKINPPFDPVTQDDLSQLNYILHILHDIAGTELGVIYFAYLISTYVPKSEKMN